MKLKMFCVFDSKVQAFTTPFFQRATAEAIRSFQDEVNKPGSQIGKYAGDYTLFELGAWDDQTAAFEIYDTPTSLGLAVNFKAME